MIHKLKCMTVKINTVWNTGTFNLWIYFTFFYKTAACPFIGKVVMSKTHKKFASIFKKNSIVTTKSRRYLKLCKILTKVVQVKHSLLLWVCSKRLVAFQDR